jgi:hypothetical protein
MNSWNKKLKPNPDVVFTIVDDEAILLEQTTGSYYGLNKVGTRMWSLLAEHGQLDKVCEQLLAEFDVEETQLKKDLEAMAAQLIEKGLLT